MKIPCRHLCLLILSIAVHSRELAAAQVPDTLLHSIFSPSTNLQEQPFHGEQVAIDGRYAAVAAPSDQTRYPITGAVRVYDTDTGKLFHVFLNPNSKYYSRFGSAIAISGTRVVVSGIGETSGDVDLGIVYVYDLSSATPTVPVVTLFPPSRFPRAGYGGSVAISGSRVVVGAPGKSNEGIKSGGAYVYDLAGGTPLQPVLTLTNPIPRQGSYGSSVAVSGDRIVVSELSPINYPYDYNSYVYDLSSGTPASPLFSMASGIVTISGTRAAVAVAWLGQVHVHDVNITPGVPYLTLTNPIPSLPLVNVFGASVALSGSLMVVRTPSDTPVPQAGAAYVFDLDATTPAQPILRLDNPDASGIIFFGRSVAVSGAKILVGAPISGNFPHRIPGGAYLFDLGSSTPTVPQTTLDFNGLDIREYFGESVALAGTRMVVGAPSSTDTYYRAGAVYIYDLSGALPFVPSLTLTNPPPPPPAASATRANFGAAVAAAGSRVVVSAGYHSTSYNLQTNRSVHVFDLESPSPTVPVITLTNPGSGPARYFGTAIALSGNRLVVQSYEPASDPLQAGSVCVFDLANPNPLTSMIVLNNPAPDVGDQFGATLAISGTHAVVGNWTDNTGERHAGSAYVYDLTSSTPGVPVMTLTNPTPKAAETFSDAVAISETHVVVGASRAYSGDGQTYNEGIVYVYDLTRTSVPAPAITLTNPVPRGSYFGGSLAISRTVLIVGSHGDRNSETGIAYVYDLGAANPSVPVASLHNPTPAFRDYFSLAVAVDGPLAVLGSRDDTFAEDRGAAYVFGLRPVLRVVPASAGLATLSWSTITSSGFALQYNENLSTTNWINAPTGESNPVTIPATNSARFYRLLQR